MVRQWKLIPDERIPALERRVRDPDRYQAYIYTARSGRQHDAHPRDRRGGPRRVAWRGCGESVNRRKVQIDGPALPASRSS